MTAPKLHTLTHPDGGTVEADRDSVDNYESQGWIDQPDTESKPSK